MQEGSFRCDANVSVRRAGETARHALRDQEPQQLPLHAAGDRIRGAPADRADRGRRHASCRKRGSTTPIATRRARCAARKTRRTTATSPIPTCRRSTIDDAWIERVRAAMPELPEAMRARLVAHARASRAYDAAQLTASRELVDYYESVCSGAAGDRCRVAQARRQLGARRIRGGAQPRRYADRCRRRSRRRNWPRSCAASSTARSRARWRKTCSTRCGHARRFRGTDRRLSGGVAGTVDAIIERRGLRQISDAGAIEALVDR